MSPDPRLPNFIYIGPDKAGSSWLHEVLFQHPEVFLTEAKDLYFFDRYFDRGLSWYRNQFRRATPEHRVVGEVCQDYLFEPEAAKRIRDCLGEINLMVTLREPPAPTRRTCTTSSTGSTWARSVRRSTPFRN
jgi:hypothetical protein